MSDKWFSCFKFTAIKFNLYVNKPSVKDTVLNTSQQMVKVSIHGINVFFKWR